MRFGRIHPHLDYSPRMLIHLVLFKYAEGTDADARARHVAALRSLAALPGVIELAAGPDIVGSARSYDTGLLARFDHRGALDAYAMHPDHVPVAEMGRAMSAQIVSVDFLA